MLSEKIGDAIIMVTTMKRYVYMKKNGKGYK